MSGTIEDQIVQMQFDNKQFESGVSTSLGTLDKLNQALQIKSGTTGITDINRAAAGLNLNPVAAGIQGINKAWLGMTTIAVTALGNITNKAVDAGLRMGKALTIDPIAAGFSNYETKINAVQTILANTADQGTKLKDVTGQLNILNEYANQTVYNFSEMAKNIGTFTAAGVDLKTSVSSIKGIANLAALSGSTSDQASSAMYQLSQAIAAGQVHLQDWNSVVNAGIGGAVFQKNLIQSALATGTLDASQVHLGKTMADTTVNGMAFRQSLTPPPGGTSWLTSGVLTKSLGTFTGDMTKAQLVTQGFTKEQAKAILIQAKTATDAATKIKTFTQLFQALKEEVASAWSKVFESLFGNINEAKAFLTPLHNLLNNAFTAPIYEIAAALKSWRKAGGFDDLIAIFKNLGAIVGNLLYPFKLIFGMILPNAGHAGKGLEGITKTIAKLTGFLADATSVTRRFGFVFNTIGTLFKDVFKAASPLFGIFKQLAPVFDFIIAKINASGYQLQNVWGNMVDGIIKGMSPGKMEKAVREFADGIVVWIKDALGIHSPAATMVPIGVNIVQGIVMGLQKAATFLLKGVQQLFVGLGKAMLWATQNIKFQDVIDVINTGLNVGLLLIFKKFVSAFGGTMKSFQTVMGQGGEVLDQIKNNLKTMQNEVRAKIIRDIAISVALLAASAILLASVDGDKLKTSLAAIGGLMVSLVASMKILTGGGKKDISAKDMAKKTAQIVAIGAAMIEFSTAIVILTGAVALMGQLDPDTIKKGLEGVAGVIALIVTATAILSKTGGGATILATATAMGIMAASLTAFAGVMVLYSKLDWDTVIRGGGTAAIVIAALGLAMQTFQKGALAGSVALVVASAGLVILAKAMQMLASIGLGNMIKIVVALDFILATIAGAANLMVEALPGAAAMIVMSASIYILAKALEVIAKLSVGDIVKGLLAIVGVIVVLGATSAALSELVPFIAAMGTALLLFGAAIALAGIGVLAFATGLGILAVVGPAAFAALGDAIDLFLEKLPKIGEAIGGFLVSILTGIAKAAQPLAHAIGKLLGILIDEVSKLVPKLKHLAITLINALFDVIVHSYAHAGKVVLGLVLKILETLADAVPKMVKKGADLIVGVIQGLGKAGVRIANATGQAILDFLNGLDKAIVKYEPKIIKAGAKIAGDLVAGMVQGIKDGVGAVGQAAENLANAALDKIKHPWEILSPSKATRRFGNYFGQGAALGIKDKHSAVEKEAGDMANKALNAMKATFNNTRNAAHSLSDIRPKIVPILDLTELERQASQIDSHMGRHTITADVSRRSARDISSEHAARHASASDSAAGDTYNFNQTNISPESLNHIKIYRGAKSQIALFKEVKGK